MEKRKYHKQTSSGKIKPMKMMTKEELREYNNGRQAVYRQRMRNDPAKREAFLERQRLATLRWRERKRNMEQESD
jgi:hypothetical protein